MKIKICGMRILANIQEIASLNPDWLGFIFYPFSKRFVGNVLIPDEMDTILPSHIQRMGVFVKADKHTIQQAIKTYTLTGVQLHGGESPSFCEEIKALGVQVVKVFSIRDKTDFDKIPLFESVADFFLFDTQTEGYGGAGKPFDHHLLTHYTSPKPFFLSGGIGIDTPIPTHPHLIGLDVNSRFEKEAGIKDVSLLRQFIHQKRNLIV